MESLTPYLFLSLSILFLYGVYRRLTRISLDDIPGPEPESFWLGVLYLTMLVVFNIYSRFTQEAWGDCSEAWWGRSTSLGRMSMVALHALRDHWA